MLRRLLIFPFVVSLLYACNTLYAPFTQTAAPPMLPSPRAANKTISSPSISRTTAPFNVAWDDRSLFRQNLTASAQNILEGLPGACVYHIAFSLADPPTNLKGMEDVRYTNQETVALTEVDFAVFSEILGGSYSMINLKINNQPVTAIHQAGLMRVPLTTPLQPGESVIIKMEFEETVPESGGDYYYGVFGYNGGILSLAHAYPSILVYNEQGWNNQMPDLDGDPLYSDSSFYLVSVDAPADLVLVASGMEVQHSESAGRQWILLADGPARDFYLAASSTFEKQSEVVGELTVNSYAPTGLKKYAFTALKVAETAIGDFSRRYAPYPYTEFDIVSIFTSAAGVEFPGLTSVAENVLNGADFQELVVAHEVGHQWFYNLVGNATQDQPWLDESMAEFVTWQYYLDRYGTQNAQSYREEMEKVWNMLDNGKIPIGLPVSAYTSEEYDAIVYNRGPLFILALRDRLGQDAFDRFIRSYTQRYQWMIATTADFKQLAEETCACDLIQLFEEWVYP